MDVGRLELLSLYCYITMPFLDPCGFTAIATPTSQPIRSPGYTTYSYASDLNCTWVLTASPGFHVQFELSDFDTENRYDVVTVGSGLRKRLGELHHCWEILFSDKRRKRKRDGVGWESYFDPRLLFNQSNFDHKFQKRFDNSKKRLWREFFRFLWNCQFFFKPYNHFNLCFLTVFQKLLFLFYPYFTIRESFLLICIFSSLKKIVLSICNLNWSDFENGILSLWRAINIFNKIFEVLVNSNQPQTQWW